MGYLFYSVSFLFLLTSTVLYLTRAIWLPHAPPIPYLTAPGPVPDTLYDVIQRVNSVFSNSNIFARGRYVRIPTSFRGDAEAGFSSASFNLNENIDGGDGRAGLDDSGKAEVQRIMKEKRLDFDEARRVYVEERFGRENIGRDGRPRDPKAVMFDRL